jgi:hypothetical protein
MLLEVSAFGTATLGNIDRQKGDVGVCADSLSAQIATLYEFMRGQTLPVSQHFTRCGEMLGIIYATALSFQPQN